MPLHFGKIGAIIAVLTIAAFLLWLMFGAFFAGETMQNEQGMMLQGQTTVAGLGVFATPHAAAQQV